MPDYAAGSIANIPATVAHWLDVPFQGLPPLPDEMRSEQSPPPRRVVVIVIDGLGWQLIDHLRRELPDLFDRAATVQQLTSVYPSTTVAALSSLWTGLAPAQHGLVGLRMFFPEWGTLGQMLKLSPEFVAQADTLVSAGLSPEHFLSGPGIAQQLGAGGVSTYSFKQGHLLNTALSRMHNRGVAHNVSIHTAADMFVQLRRLLLRSDRQRYYVSAYWPSVDGLMHYQGPYSDSVMAEARVLLETFDRELLRPLAASGKGDTMLCIAADHGQISTPAKQQVNLSDHPALATLLLMRPSGEPRAPYLYAKHGAGDELLAYIRERLPEAMTAFPAEEALASGLFGPPPHAPESAGRLGDVVVAMRAGYVLLSDDEPGFLKKMVGRHGGLSAEEMLVPWLVFRA